MEPFIMSSIYFNNKIQCNLYSVSLVIKNIQLHNEPKTLLSDKKKKKSPENPALYNYFNLWLTAL